MNTTFGFFKSMTSSGNDNEVEIRDIISGFNKFQVMYALQLLKIWRKRKSAYSSLCGWIEYITERIWAPIYLLSKKQIPDFLCPLKRKIVSIDIESKHARSGWSKKLSRLELNAVEKVHEYWTREIDQHAYYRNICGESTYQTVAPEKIEANYRALLARIRT